MSTSTFPTPSKTLFNVSTLLSKKIPFLWLSTMRVVSTHSETLTALDGAMFTGYMFEITHIVSSTHKVVDKTQEEEEEESGTSSPSSPSSVSSNMGSVGEDEDEALKKYVWCIARRYRQFVTMQKEFRSQTMRTVPVPKKGWLWSSSTDDTRKFLFFAPLLPQSCPFLFLCSLLFMFL
jgi:hypothetical protein